MKWALLGEESKGVRLVVARTFSGGYDNCWIAAKLPLQLAGWITELQAVGKFAPVWLLGGAASCSYIVNSYLVESAMR